MSEQTNEDLLIAWQRGDRDAGGALFERFQGPLSGFLIRFVGTEDDVKDILSKLFMSLVRRPGGGGFRGQSSCKTYLFAAARFQMLSHFRSRHRYNAKIKELEDFTTIEFAPDPSSYSDYAAQRYLVAKALRRIPFKYQLVLELVFWEGMNAREASEVLGQNHNTVRKWSRLAKHAFEAKYKELGGVMDKLGPETVTYDRFLAQLSEAARRFGDTEADGSRGDRA